MSTFTALRALRDALASAPEHAAGVAAIDHVLGVAREHREAHDALNAAFVARARADAFATLYDAEPSVLPPALVSAQKRKRLEALRRTHEAALERVSAAERALAELLGGEL